MIKSKIRRGLIGQISDNDFLREEQFDICPRGPQRYCQELLVIFAKYIPGPVLVIFEVHQFVAISGLLG